jgi:molybdate transport system ATP-binding protein
VPHSATHAVILDHGRIVYRGTISRAPLTKWLAHDARDGHAAHGAHDVRARGTRAARGVRAPRGADAARRTSTESPLQGARQRKQSAGLHPALPTRLTRAASPLVKVVNADVYLDEHKALERLSFEVFPGECWVIHGANGSGKTTLLRTLYGDHGVASHGSIHRAGIVPGVPLQEFKARAGFVAAHIQTIHPQHLTVDEIVQSGRHATDRKAATKALEFFGLKDFGKRTREELSYGQMRRVLFARAWVTHPRLLLLDEPLAGIDAPTRGVLIDRIGQLVAKGTAVVMTTHHRDEWPPYATHELELEAGRMKYAGPMRSRA